MKLTSTFYSFIKIYSQQQKHIHKKKSHWFVDALKKREKRRPAILPLSTGTQYLSEVYTTWKSVNVTNSSFPLFFFFFNSEHRRGKKRRRQTRSSWRDGNTETGISMLNIQTGLKSCLNLTSTISIKMRNKVIFLFTLMDLILSVF